MSLQEKHDLPESVREITHETIAWLIQRPVAYVVQMAQQEPERYAVLRLGACCTLLSLESSDLMRLKQMKTHLRTIRGDGAER